MKQKKLNRLYGSFLTMLLILSMIAPYASAAQDTNVTPNESVTELKNTVNQQTKLLSQNEVLHPMLQDLTGDSEIDVIVTFSEKPVGLEEGISKLAGKSFTKSDITKVKSKIKAQQDNAKKILRSKKITFKEGYSYNTVLNGIAMTVKQSDLKTLSTLDDVVLVEPDTQVTTLGNPVKEGTAEAAMNTSAPHLGIPTLWEQGFEGQGIKVGVIDTGIDYLHPEFAGVYKGGHNFVPQTSTANYTRDRAADDPYETMPSERPSSKPIVDANGNEFFTSHGTHVSGTIAAIGNNPYGIKGLAPKVELHAYRVLGAYGSGNNSWIIAGIEKAVQEDMDVINLSLGGSTNSSTASDAIAINNAMLSGTVAVIATGNSGPNRGTIGNPSTAALGIAVGNSTNPEINKSANVKISAGSFSSDTNVNMMAWTFGVDPKNQLTGEFDLVSIPKVGNLVDFDGIDVKGKIVLIARGDIAFVDKVANAKEKGAVGVIIHNSAAGTGTPGPTNIFLGDAFGFIPTFDMSYTEGMKVRDALAINRGKVTFSNFVSQNTLGDAMNDSSSRGPANPFFDIKPDVTAPGTNIMSSVAAYGKDNPSADYSKSYDRYTGTSMATPHIVGIVALLKNVHPEWSPFDIKVALSNTAKILDKTKFDVFAQGPGRVQPVAAAFTEALAYSVDTTVSNGKTEQNLKGTVTFGKLGNLKDAPASVTKNILVKNLTGNPSDYNVSVEVTKKATGTLAAANVTVDQTSFTLTDEKTLKVTLNAPQGTNTNGNEILGYIHITNGKTNLSLPFAADFSPALITGIKAFSIDSLDLSYAPTSTKKNTTVRYEFFNTHNTTYIEFWDMLNPDGHLYEDGYIGYLVNATRTTTGAKTVAFNNGSYTPWGGSVKATLPDGLYTVDLTAANPQTGADPVSFADLGPLFVKSTPATIETTEAHEVNGNDYTFTAKVLDKYIDYQQILESEYGLGFNVNSKLTTSYVLKDKNGNVTQEGPVLLEQDGNFEIKFTNVPLGTNTLTINIVDAASNKTTAEYSVIRDGVESLDVDSNIEFTVGEKEQLAVNYVVTESDGTKTKTDVTSLATFSNYDENIISFEDGIVTAIGEGVTEITVKYADFEAKVTVKVNKADVLTISVSPSNLQLKVGQSGNFEVTSTVTKYDGTKTETDVTDVATYTFDDSIVSVENGVVTAVAEGTATITIEYAGEVSTVQVKVEKADVNGISVNPSSVSLKVGETDHLVVTQTVTAYDGSKTEKDVTALATYSGFNTSVITIDKGTITAVGEGTTNITINFENEVLTVPVTVKKADEIILSVNPTNVNVNVGKTDQLTVKQTLKQAGKDDVITDVTQEATYVVENKEVIAVEKGVITAKTVGTSKVNVTFGDNTVIVVVNVTEAPITETKTLSVNKANVQMIYGNKETLVVTETITKGNSSTNTDVSATAVYSGYDSKVVKVDKGVITTTGVGSTTIDVTVGDNKVKVLVTVSSIPPQPPITDPKPDPTPAPTPVTFGDVTTHWAKKEIEALATKRIILGVANDSFAPEAKLTRAQFAVLVSRALELDLKAYEGKFSDVPASKDWAYAGIEAAARAGIINGKLDGSFDPDANITREEIAAIIVRAVNHADASLLKDLDTSKVFKDDANISTFASLSVKQAVALGIVNGRSGNKFDPKASATRAEAAVMLYRALDKLGEF
ncbi:S8 family serine peptidase [Paenisporosarcina indica]|uniref:S8 family serine peptidase n=1 Tax=Paenisporosarcina indica TaxID=650093 RepID=UPI00094F7B2B|nr:S8 family serine peptidase [Paenisporosarcina indica]